MVEGADDLYERFAAAVFTQVTDRALARQGLKTIAELAPKLGKSRSAVDRYRSGETEVTLAVMLRALKLAEMLALESFAVVAMGHPEFLEAIPHFEPAFVNRQLSALRAMQADATSDSPDPVP